MENKCNVKCLYTHNRNVIMISFPNIRMNPLFLGFWYNVLVSTTYVCNDCGFVCNTMELTLPNSTSIYMCYYWSAVHNDQQDRISFPSQCIIILVFNYIFYTINTYPMGFFPHILLLLVKHSSLNVNIDICMSTSNITRRNPKPVVFHNMKANVIDWGH